MQRFNIRNMQTRHEKFQFQPRGISEFRETSHESLLLTGTPSVCNLKFSMRTSYVLEIPVTANGCEFSKHSLYSRTNVGNPTTMLSLSETVLCDSLLLGREYSESSGDLHVSVSTPELQPSNTFINVLSLSMMHVERLPSKFRECSEESL